LICRGPPSFDGIPTEAANKFTFDIHKNQWVKTTTQVKIDPVPFSRGALRFVYHLKETDQTGSYVAKMSFDPRDALDRSVYFKDVEMQCYAREYAKKFNEYNPPKAVDFVAAWNLELIQRPGRPICGVERYIDGQYAKHNNNYGYVCLIKSD
jgi:elongation factor 2 kinase